MRWTLRLVFRQLRSSLEAEVDLIVPGDSKEASKFLELLYREGSFIPILPFTHH
jgi:hypothetical protein